jgi:hypothetical protein
MRPTLKKFGLGLIFLCLFGTRAYGWGEVGHHAICGVATKLVQQESLQRFLKSRPHIMGHLCNLADISWKSKPDTKIGEATHFIDPENIDQTPASISADYASVSRTFKNYFSKRLGRTIHLGDDVGSLWWRGQQFFDQARNAGRDPREADATNRVYNMMVAMGLLGHFVGDASQSLHNTANYDGYDNGHGGLHSFYETAVVNELSFLDLAGETLPDIQTQVYVEAQRIRGSSEVQKILEKTTTAEVMKALSEKSWEDLSRLYELDHIEAPSSMINGQKTPAKRKPAKDVATVFRPIAIHQLAIASVVLANLWDRIMNDVGPLPLDQYRSYRYPLDVDFVSPNYLIFELK